MHALEEFVRAERQFLSDELKWLAKGARLFSPGGDDISAHRKEELEARIEHATKALGDA